MSSLTDMSRRSLPPLAKQVSRRARLAPFVSAAFAALAFAILVLFAVQAGFITLFTARPSKPPVAKPAEQTTVSQSTVTGFDKQNRPYSVSAQSAVQDKDAPNRVHLQTVNGEIQRSNGEAVKVKANTGLYDTEAKQLDLAGAVEIISEGRFVANMETARVSVRDKKLVSYSPVTVKLTDGGTIEAKALQITNDGDNILFFNGVRAKFTGTSSKGKGSP